MNQYFEYLRNEVPILTYFLKSIRKIKKKKFEPLSKCYVLFTPWLCPSNRDLCQHMTPLAEMDSEHKGRALMNQRAMFLIARKK